MDEKKLKDAWGKMEVSEIAAKFDLSVSRVYFLAKQAGLTKRPLTVEELKVVWGIMEVEDIAEMFHVSPSTVYSRARSAGLPTRSELLEARTDRLPGDPDEEEIARATKAIRRSWGRTERISRIVGPKNADARYTTPTYESAVLLGQRQMGRC